MITFELLKNEPEHSAYAAGEMIFEQGDPSTGMFVVLDGEVDVVAAGQVVDTVAPGGVFGELGLIDSEPRSASARARTACRVALIDQKRFMTLVQRTPNFALQMLRLQAERLRRRPMT
jgi:CRP/FNR family cyclic AMP-dependent transcriptional regulator